MKKFPIFCGYKAHGFWWFRIYGYGVRFKNLKYVGLMFSERHGSVKTITIFNFNFKLLKP